MYPDRDTLRNVPRSGYITARDQSMVKNGVTEGGKNVKHCQFFFFVNEHNNTNMKPQAKSNDFQSYPRLEEKQQLVEEKDADNIRKVLCKSFIQWF